MADKDLYAELAARALTEAPGTLLRRLPGREVFTLAPAAGGRVLVKRFTERLAWPGWTRLNPALREAGALAALAREGFPVPAVLATRACPEGRWGRRSVLLLEWVEHRQSLRERLREASGLEARGWARALAELVARFHGAGWHHRDLYLQHILVRAGELVLIDLGRARPCPRWRTRWFVKDLAALVHSCPRAVPQRARLEFFVRYARARGLSDAERRRFLAAALAKERRMAAHTPRHGEEQGWTDR
jgi:RIO-like serine/threonine protein kinase